MNAAFRKYFRDIFGPEIETFSRAQGIAMAPIQQGQPVTREQLRPTVRSAPSREAFAAWREHPVTLFVFAALNRAAAEQQTTWATTSWHGGTADQALLSELRVRADAYRAIEEGGYEAFCEWAGVEPEAKLAE